jgi:galactose mutarotase-like enzyme
MAPSTTCQNTKVTLSSVGGFQQVCLQNACISVSFLPELGGKMVSLKRVEGGREFLLQAQNRPYSRPTYGANFEDYDTSGFDECFPSVSACEYPHGNGGSIVVPDHGELWSVPWQYEVRNEELLLAAFGRISPYVFRKRVRLDKNRVILNYEVESRSDQPFVCLWSAHPLLAVSPGCSIILPNAVSEMFVNWSRANRLGKFGDKCGWPIVRETGGTEVNLAQLSSIQAKTADKLFTPRLNEGYCAVYYRTSDESLSFQFDTSSVPYLGLWICQGGWPSPDRGHFTLALEPCSGRPDSLAEAVQRGECQVLPPGEKKSWELTIQIQEGYPWPR